MRRNFLLNAFSGVAMIATNALLLIVMVPVIVDTLGFDAYGLFALMTSLSGLGVFVHFGFNTSLIKFLVEQRDDDSSGIDIAVTALIVATASSIVAGLLLAFRETILSDVLNVPPDIRSTALLRLYNAAVLCLIFQVVGQIPSAVLDSRQKVYLTNGVNISVGVLTRGAMLISLVLAPALDTLGWIMLAGAVANVVSLTVAARWVWGPISVDGFRQRWWTTTLKHVRYGRSIQAASILHSFYEPLTKILVSRFIGVQEVGFLDIALRAKGLVWSVLERMLYPFLPILAEKTGEGQGKEIIERIQSVLSMLLIPLMIAIVWYADALVEVWLGSHHPMIVFGISTIVPCYLVAILFLPTYQFLAVRGYPEKTLILQALNVTLNIGLFATLTPIYGYKGAVIAFCSAVIASSILTAWYQRSIVFSVVFHAFRPVRNIIIIVFATLVTTTLVVLSVPGEGMRLVVAAIVHPIVLLWLFRLLAIVHAEDIDRVTGGHSMMGVTLRRLLIRGV